MLTKNLIIKNLIDDLGIDKKDAHEITTIFFDSIAEALCNDKNVVLRHFGSFRLCKLPARVTKHIKTGENINIPEMKSFRFKAGKSIKCCVYQ